MGKYRVTIPGGVCAALALGAAVGGCGNSVVAIVNGQKISQKQFHEALESRYGEDTIIDLINERLVEEEATKAGVMPTEADVDQEVAEVQSRAPSPEEFAAALRRQGLTLERYREGVKRTIVMRRLLTKDIKVTPEEVKTFYDKHKTDFGKPARVNYSQIVCSTMEAAKAAKSAVQGGADFGAVASQKSVDETTKGRGGIVGWVPDDMIMPVELRDPISALKEGEIAGPYEANGVYYVVMVTAKAKEDVPDFKDPAVSARVEEALKVQKVVQQGLNPDNYVAELMRKANVNVLWQDYRHIVNLYQPIPSAGFGLPGEPGAPGPGNAALPAQPPAPPAGQPSQSAPAAPPR